VSGHQRDRHRDHPLDDSRTYVPIGFGFDFYGTSYTSASVFTSVFTSVLNEGSGDIQVCYYETSFGTATYDDGAGATIGINNGPGADALQFS